MITHDTVLDLDVRARRYSDLHPRPAGAAPGAVSPRSVAAVGRLLLRAGTAIVAVQRSLARRALREAQPTRVPR